MHPPLFIHPYSRLTVSFTPLAGPIREIKAGPQRKSDEAWREWASLPVAAFAALKGRHAPARRVEALKTGAIQRL